tara:strand:+ start:8774 stop:9436 length:663 start_codon:yes stop_codon:yes gene_type:complete
MPDNKKRMTPIRVPDMVWMKEDIRDKFTKHRRVYETERDSLINENLDKAIPKYIKVMGCEKVLAEFKKAHEARKEFELTMQTKLDILRAKEAEVAMAIQDKVNDHIDSNPSSTKDNRNRNSFQMNQGYGSDHDRQPDIYYFNKFVAEKCRDEAELAYEKSAKGAALKHLNDAENACIQVLHSGYDITDARRFIDDVFKQVGIDSPRVPDISQGLAWDGNK